MRAARQADAEVVRELVFGVLGEFGLAPSHEGIDQDLYDLEKWYAARGGCFEVIEDNSLAIVGTYGVYPLVSPSVSSDTLSNLADNDRTGLEKANPTGRAGNGCELRKMYLAATERGNGLGHVMMNRAIQFAREAGFTWMELETAACLKTAIKLYQSYGFEPMVDAELSERCDLRMIRRLPSIEVAD